MKSIRDLAWLTLAASLMALPGLGAACSSFATLDTVIGAGNCTVGSVTFSGFTYSNASATQVAASDVFFSAGGTGAPGNFAGFAVSTIGGWQAPFSLAYNVSCNACNFTNAEVNANVQPTINNGGMTLTYADSAGTLTLGVTPNGDLYHTLTTATTGVSNILNAGGPQDRLQALQNNFYVTASATPEPASNILFASGLLALAVLARNRIARRS